MCNIVLACWTTCCPGKYIAYYKVDANFPNGFTDPGSCTSKSIHGTLKKHQQHFNSVYWLGQPSIPCGSQ